MRFIINREPTEKMMHQKDVYNGIFIPEKFKNTILKHLILNYSKNINNFSPPLILAIQGLKGEGKSFMLEKLCDYYSIDYIPISGAELCGNLEGDSVKKIIKEYESACIKAADNRGFSCIVIDDFHKSLAASNQDNMAKTTNSDTLVGRLMNLSDNPYICNQRIPIIVTGNNFKSIYPALTRHSRMEIFDWEPEIEDKKKIVYHIFRQFFTNIDYTTICTLVEKYKTQYVAFFKSVAQDAFFNDFSSIIATFEDNINNVNLDNITDIVTGNLVRNIDISLENIMKYAEMRNKKIPKNFDKEQNDGNSN